MATTIFCFSLFLALVFFSLYAETTLSAPPTVVHVISNMPKGSPPVSIECKVNGTYVIRATMKVGEEYQWSATTDAIYYCEPIWEGLTVLWNVYEPGRDTGHAAVFSRMEEDGFFLSYDKSNWKKVADWRKP